jgi:hypothetical protein
VCADIHWTQLGLWIVKGEFMHTFIVMVGLVVSCYGQQARKLTEIVPTDWGSLTGGWQVALHCEKQSYVANEPIWVELVARNVGPKMLNVHIYRSDWMAASFKVLRVSDGQVITVRPYRHEGERLDRASGGFRTVPVAPGKLVSPAYVNLRQLFDLPAGTYSVTGTCELPSQADGRKLAVSSNQITVIVVARP